MPTPCRLEFGLAKYHPENNLRENFLAFYDVTMTKMKIPGRFGWNYLANEEEYEVEDR